MPDLPGTRHREVVLEDVVLHVVELGPPAAAPVLLVHGWPQNWWCWSRVAPLLADDYRLLIPDLRGHGWSSAPSSGYEKEQLADDLLGLLDELGLERVAYVGHDWGAYIGLLLAIREPTRLSHLVALSIPHLWPSMRDRLNPLRAMTLAYQLPLSTPVLGGQLMRRGLTRRVLAGASAGFSARDIEVYEATMGSEAGARTTTAMYRSFVLKELPAIALGRYRDARLDVPTQLIVGGRDPITRVSDLDGYEQHAPRMRVERVPDAGHFLPQERPDLVAQRLIAGLEAYGSESKVTASAR
jgi:pimeloyl-ACP methyl ester carboxylesterase